MWVFLFRYSFTNLLPIQTPVSIIQGPGYIHLSFLSFFLPPPATTAEYHRGFTSDKPCLLAVLANGLDSLSFGFLIWKTDIMPTSHGHCEDEMRSCLPSAWHLVRAHQNASCFFIITKFQPQFLYETLSTLTYTQFTHLQLHLWSGVHST